MEVKKNDFIRKMYSCKILGTFKLFYVTAMIEPPLSFLDKVKKEIVKFV